MLPQPGFFIVVGIIPLGMLFAYLTRRLQTQERLRLIEKGVALTDEGRSRLDLIAPLLRGKVVDPWERAANSRRVGIVFVAMGLGTFIFGWACRSFNDQAALPFMAGAAIPILLGLGLLLEYRLRVRDLKARNAPPQN